MTRGRPESVIHPLGYTVSPSFDFVSLLARQTSDARTGRSLGESQQARVLIGTRIARKKSRAVPLGNAARVCVGCGAPRSSSPEEHWEEVPFKPSTLGFRRSPG